jgi:ThiF family protein
MRSWTERYPDRFDYELAEFARRDLDFELDRELLAEQGRVVLRGVLPRGDGEIELEVRYPDLFPFVRPEIFAGGLVLHRHQNPYDGNLCLLDRSSRAWSPSDTGAWLVAERVPLLLHLIDVGDEQAMRDAEAPQGEPLSTYFPSALSTTILVPAAALGLSAETRAGAGRIAFAPNEPPSVRVRGLLAELVEKKRNRKTRVLAQADEPLLDRFGGKRLPFRWVRLDEAPPSNTPVAVLEAIEAAGPGFASPNWESVEGGEIVISAAVFAEEVRQGEFEDTWVFVVQMRQEGQGGRYLIHGERLSRTDLEQRLPAYLCLGNRTASLSGLGALGSKIALELARAGLGSLRGLDFDTVEAGTTVRWAGGLTAVGHLKTEYMRQRIAADYPYTRFEPFQLHVGASAFSQAAGEQSELELLEGFLDGTDLLIEASAEIGIQHVLATLAEEVGVTQLYVWATEGARGGAVAFIDPAEGGCWLCLQHWLEDGTIPLPAHDAPRTLQPRGCGSLTYTAAGFDLAPIIAQAARAAAAVLTGESAGSTAYICSFPEDAAGPPSWSTHRIESRNDCPICAERDR